MPNYQFILIFFISALLISFCLILVSKYFAPKRPNPEKNSAYECGYNPIESGSKPYSIQFSLVAILFLIFGIETIFLIPFAYAFKSLPIYSIYIMSGFLIILTVGFIYEWLMEALSWE